MNGRIGPYELRAELGRGAMAVVWRAFDPELEREVAIKEPVIPHGTSAEVGREFAERFVREGKAAARLNHPGIVTIHAAGVFDGRPAIVMELIEGQTLAELMRAQRVPPEAALAIVDQLLDAVAFAHEHGVVHRDIKPDNIFVTADGRVKLADFGIAHSIGGATLTQAGTVMGTPGYMAPEQIKGLPADARADIFSIGVIAYELLAGTDPFGVGEGQSPTTVMYRVVNEPPPPLASLGLDRDAVVQGTVLAALSKDPDDRPASARAFRDMLAGSAYTATVPRRSPTGLHESARGRGAGSVWAYVAAAVVVLAVLAVVFWPRTPAASTPSVAMPASPAASVAATASAPDAAAGAPASAPDAAPFDASTLGDPRDAVRAYWDACNRRDIDAAWKLFSIAHRKRNSYSTYRDIFDDLVSAEVLDISVASTSASQAVLHQRVRTNNRTEGVQTNEFTTYVVVEGGSWKIDRNVPR